MHVLFASCRIGVAAVRCIFSARFCRGNGFPFLAAGKLPVHTDDNGYVLLINIGHNSLNAVQPSFFADCFIRLYATAVHQLALSWGRLWQGIHAVYR